MRSEMMDHIDLYDPNLYINRELSWLEFNRRCLDEAGDKGVPLLERLKFLAICYGNLDEFFMIRVPGIVNGIVAGAPILDAPDIEHDTSRLLSNINSKVEGLLEGYNACWLELRSALSEKGIRILSIDDLSDEQTEAVDSFYNDRIHPLLTPLALDVSHPFPFISSNTLSLAVKMEGIKGQVMYARIKMPLGPFNRFVRIPSESSGFD